MNEMQDRVEFTFEAAVRMRDRFLQQEVWDRMGVAPKDAGAAGDDTCADRVTADAPLSVNLGQIQRTQTLHEHQRGFTTDAAAGFVPLGNERGGAQAGQPLRALLDVPAPRDTGVTRAALRAEVIAALNHSELVS